MIQTPRMFTWGASESKDVDKNPNGKYAFNLQFKDEKSEEEQIFYDGLQHIVSSAINYMVENSVEIYGKARGRDTIEAMMEPPMIKYRKITAPNGTKIYDTTSPPFLSVKCDHSNTEFNASPTVFNEDCEMIFDPKEEDQCSANITAAITRGDVLAGIRSGGLWISPGGAIYLTWKLEQAVVYPKASTAGPHGVCLLMGANPDDDDQMPHKPNNNQNGSDDDDDDDDDDDNASYSSGTYGKTVGIKHKTEEPTSSQAHDQPEAKKAKSDTEATTIKVEATTTAAVPEVEPETSPATTEVAATAPVATEVAAAAPAAATAATVVRKKVIKKAPAPAAP